MAGVLLGPRTWSMTRDEEGYRVYNLTNRIETTSKYDGPQVVANTPGLPLPGSFWAIGNDVDLFAYCTHDLKVTPVNEGKPNYYWDVENTFTNKPKSGKKCSESSLDDPLLEPQKISGSFNKVQTIAVYDRYGNEIKYSSHERPKGELLEFDDNKATVRVEQNVPDLQLPLLTLLINTVNSFELWGIPPRCVKFDNVSWERKFYGQCYIYFVRTLEFDINFNGFDRELIDEGNMVLRGRWDLTSGPSNWRLTPINGVDPDPDNPSDFIRATDAYGNPIHMILNGAGLPANAFIGSDSASGQRTTPGVITVEYYSSSDLALLNIPSNFTFF